MNIKRNIVASSCNSYCSENATMHSVGTFELHVTVNIECCTTMLGRQSYVAIKNKTYIFM